MKTCGCLRSMMPKCKFSQHPSIRLLMLFASVFILLYMITEMNSDLTKIIENMTHFSRNLFSRSKISIFTHGHIPSNLYKSSYDIRTKTAAKDIQAIPHRKSEKWYLSAIRKLSHKKVTPSTLLLEQPYFQPNPKTRYEMSDEEILSPPACSDSDKTRIVVLILSEPKSLKSRTAIRQTWGSVASRRQWPWVDFTMDIKILFVVGVRSINGSTNGSESSTNAWDDSQLKAESGTYNDILQLSAMDSYSNLTRKVVLGFKWINKNCPKIQYVIKADQDIFVNVPLLWQFLVHYGKNNSIYGHMYFHGNVKRTGRWALSKSVVPISTFPAYASGTSYVISLDAVAKVLDNYYLFPYVSIEDAFITGIVAAVAKIDRYNVKGFTHWSENTSDSCRLVMDRIYTVNGVNTTSIREMWCEIEGRGNGRCI